jgi:hypothetical protein
MKQKITFLLLFACGFVLVFGQTAVNNFEAGSADPFGAAGGATWAVVDNPKKAGSNTTDKCLRIGRTGTNWWELVGIDINPDLSLTNQTKFLSVWVYGAITDVGARLDKDLIGNPWGTYVSRSTTLHSGADQWEQIIIPIIAADGATTFNGNVPFITFHADIGGAPVPGYQLNNTDTFLYIDEIQILDSNPLLSTSNFELEKSISLYPNPAQSSFKITTRNNVAIENVSVYTLLGKQIQNIARISTNEYDISGLASGLYIVKMIDSNGVVASKKLLKN